MKPDARKYSYFTQRTTSEHPIRRMGVSPFSPEDDTVGGTFRVLDNSGDTLYDKWQRGDISQPDYWDGGKKIRWEEAVRACERLGPGPVSVKDIRSASEIHIRFRVGKSYRLNTCVRDMETMCRRGCVEAIGAPWKKRDMARYEYIRDFNEETDFVFAEDSHWAQLKECTRRGAARAKKRRAERKWAVEEMRRKGTVTIDSDYE